MTPWSSYVWSPANAGFLRSRRCAGGRRGTGEGDDRGLPGHGGPCTLEEQEGGCRGDPRPRRGQGQLAHTPFQARAVCAERVPRGESLSFPAWRRPFAPRARASQPWAARYSAHWVAGGRGRRTCSPAALGRVAPRPAGLGRAIPEKVCRAGLGEQRPGGRTRHICGLVCDSIPLTRRFKGRTASLARKRKNLGAGRLGRISVRSRSLGAAPSSRLGQCCFIRALDPGHSPATSPQQARFTTPSPGSGPRNVRQERRNIKWIPAGAADAARRRAPRRGRCSRGSALRPGAHARPDRRRRPGHPAGRATPPPLSALAQLSGKAGRRILAPQHAEAPPRSGSLYFGRISLNSVTKLREGDKFPEPARRRRRGGGLAHLVCSCRVPRLYSSFPSWRKTDS